jgi:peptide deformylase
MITSNTFKNKSIKLHIKSDKCIFPLDEQSLTFIKEGSDFLRKSKLKINNTLFPPSVGLAFNQVGIYKSILLINYKKDVFEMINPKIINHEGIIFLKKGESCLSVFNKHIGINLRHKKIDVEYFDKNGNHHFKTFDGMISIIIQHEIDHLNGILFYESKSYKKGVLNFIYYNFRKEGI